MTAERSPPEITVRDALSSAERHQLVALWNAEFPRQLAHGSVADLDAYLAGLGAPRHLVIEEDGRLTGWLVLFERDGAPWFAMIVDRARHGRGYGRALLERAQQLAPALHGWVVDHDRDRRADGTPYPSPLPFYLRLGFRPVPDVRADTPLLSTVLIRWERA